MPPDGGPRNAVDLAAELQQRYAKHLETKRRVTLTTTNRASALGHPCVRYLVLLRRRGHEFELPDPGLQAIFDQGNHIEQATIRELQALGYEWIWSQRPFTDPARQISGHVDGAVSLAGGAAVPGEIKSMQGSHFDRIRDGVDGLHDLLHHPQWYIRKYPVQVGIYLHLANEPDGVIILRDKWFWRMKVVPILRSEVQDLVDEAFRNAEQVNRHLADDTLPERIEYDKSICGRCEARNICLPGYVGAGAAILDDSELRDKLVELEQLDEYVRRHKDLKEEVTDDLKTRLAALGVTEAVIAGTHVANLSTTTRKRMKAVGEEYESTTLNLKPLDAPLVPVHGSERK